MKEILNNNWFYFQNAFKAILLVIIVGVLVGLVTSLLALGFMKSVLYFNNLLFISPQSRLSLIDQHLWLNSLTVMVPSLGGLLVGCLLYYLSSLKRVQGPADVIFAVQTRDISVLKTKDGIVTTIASILSLGFGASVGQYGPMVVMGSVVGLMVQKLKINLPNISNIAIACGVAAAISAAFNAPIAGILFAHEAIVRHYSLQMFAPITVASSVAYIVSNVIFETPTLFEVSFGGVQFAYEFLLFALTGLLGGLISILLMHSVIYFSRLSAKINVHFVFKPAIAGFVLGLCAIQLPEVLGAGQETLRFATIEEAFGLKELVVLMLAKLFLSALCLGFGFAGGVFNPSLIVGVLWGALVSSFIIALGMDSSGVIVYAVCGMTAVASSTIGAPLTMILIVFELTRNYEITIAAMVAVVFSNLVAYKVFDRSLFDRQLKERGLSLAKNQDETILDRIKILPYAKKEVAIIDEDVSIDKAVDYLQMNQLQEICLIDKNKHYLGKITLARLLKYSEKMTDNINQSDVKDDRHPTIKSNVEKQKDNSDTAKNSNINLRNARIEDKVVFYGDTSVWQAMILLQDFIGESITILESKENPIVVAQIYESNVISAYFDLLKYIRQE